jgi:phosphoribosylformylglycinamidine synthase
VSDGGLYTTVLEMCLAGHRGMVVDIIEKLDPIVELFHEEAGIVFEYDRAYMQSIRRCFTRHGARFSTIGHTRTDSQALTIRHGNRTVYEKKVWALRPLWEDTSTRLEGQQANAATVQSEAEMHTLRKPFADYALPYRPALIRTKVSPKNRVAILREEGINGDREMTAAFMWAGCDPIDVNTEDLKGADERVFDEFRGLVYPGGFSYSDTLGSAKGWAAPVLFDPKRKAMFDRFYDRPDTFSFGVCNGFQFMTLIGVLPKRGIPVSSQPRLVHNTSERFESRWVTVEIRASNNVLLRGMAGLRYGVWVAHGEGQLVFPDHEVWSHAMLNNLAPMVYVGPDGHSTRTYPFNPNGSVAGWAGLSSECGRHLGWMPHAERCILPWQCPWIPWDMRHHHASPWLKLFQNARAFCEE